MQAPDRFSIIDDRELADLIDGLQRAFDHFNRGDAFRRGRLSAERAEALAAINAAIIYLVEQRRTP